MNLGFDAKRAYRNRTGLGNYSRGLLDGIDRFLGASKQEQHQLNLS